MGFDLHNQTEENSPDNDQRIAFGKPGQLKALNIKFGNLYTLLKDKLGINALLTSIGQPNGIAPLDGAGNLYGSDKVPNQSLLAIGATVTAAIDFIMGLFINYPLWSVLANTEYTATPASVNTITTSSDTSTNFNVGDVLRVELTGALIRYVKVQNISPTLITVFGDLLTADIVSIRYERGNNAAIQHYEVWVGSDEIYLFGDARPTIRKTNGGAATAPVNTNYGSDIFYEKQLRVDKGTLVYARYTAHELDSSVTPATLEMKFGANTVVNWSIDALAGDSGAIVADYANTEDIYPVVNVTNPSGDKKVSFVKLFFEMFNDKDPI